MGSQSTTTLQSKDVSRFFLILTVFFGLSVRLFPLFRVNFPLVDGGMFYSMIRDLQDSHFILPLFTTYNHADIPYAYPPLAFYIAGWVSLIPGISLISVVKWMPAIVTILIVPCFYFFASRILNSEPKAALATLIFTLTPNSYWWDIVGGGLTRSMGTFFFTIAIAGFYQMYREKKPVWMLVSILGGTGVVLSHPAWTLQLAVVIPLLWFFWGRTRQGTVNSLIVLAGMLLLTSPWWVTVIYNHGLGIFLQAGQVTHSRWLSWTILFALSFTGEYTPVIGVFALIGLFIHLAKKEYFFPLWATLCIVVDPRGGPSASIFPFAIMAMTTITDGIAPLLLKKEADNQAPDSWMYSLNSTAGRLFFGFFVILFLYGAYSVSDTISYQVVGVEEFKTIDWVKSNTNAADRFLILDEQGNPLLSPFTEWFPALADRRSIATIQGTEWLDGSRHYNQQLSIINDVHSCLYQSVDCIQGLQDKLADKYDYIIVSSRSPVPLLGSLESSTDFRLTYSSPTIKIFKFNGT
jgi:hypothetical protein